MAARRAALIALVLSAVAATDAAASAIDSLPGIYGSRADPNGVVTILPFSGYKTDRWAMTIRGYRWEAVGFMRDSAFAGVIRRVDVEGRPLPEPAGSLGFVVGEDGRIEARARFPEPARGFEDTWTRTGKWGDKPKPRSSPPDSLPRLGEYVPVEELPEALTKVPPEYPAAARRGGVEGTVLVQALVRGDGTVAECRIMKSIPGLDDAAKASVMQWRFKPAMAGGKPVAVWVAIPVRFSLR